MSLPLCSVCLLPAALLYQCDQCDFLGCPYVDRGQSLSHAQSHHHSTLSLLETPAPKKTLKTKSLSQCSYLESFTFSSFENGFNLVIFKKPYDHKINEYLNTTLKVVAQFLKKNAIDQSSITVYMDSQALQDLAAMDPPQGFVLMSTSGLDLEILPPDQTLIITLGGDGTILYAASHFQSSAVPPILGFYMGTLGFMCNNKIEHLEKVVTSTLYQLLANLAEQYEERARLQGQMGSTKFTCMNEMVVSSPQTVHLDILLNGKSLTKARCRGIIVATGTGSTAYNLSAGGPLLYSGVHGLILTPICPLSLSFRPIVLPVDAVLSIGVSSDSPVEQAQVYADGRKQPDLICTNQVVISKSTHGVKCKCLFN